MADWTPEEKMYLGSFLGLGLIDWGQTRDIVKKPNYYEKHNLYLGKNPSMGKVDTYFPIALGGTALAAHLLPKYRKDILKYGSLLELGMVNNNYKIGLKVNF